MNCAPKETRTLRHPPELLRLKMATKKLVAQFGTALAGETIGMRQQYASDVGLNNTPHFLRIHEAVELEEAAQGSDDWPQVTRAMAAHHGFVLLPLPKAPSGGTRWHRHLAKMAKEQGEAIAKLAEALADGKLTPREAAIAIIELDQSIQIQLEIKAMLLAIIAEGDE